MNNDGRVQFTIQMRKSSYVELGADASWLGLVLACPHATQLNLSRC